MSNENQKDALFLEEEEETIEEAVDTAAEEADVENDDVIEDENGIIDEDPFENAFQYTEEDTPKVSNWPVVVLAVLLVLVLVGGVLWSTGIFSKEPAGGNDAATVEPFGIADVSDALAATCEDITVSNGAIAFFMEMEYQNSDQYLSYDKSKPLKGQDESAYNALVTSAKSQFEWMLTMNASAKKNGTQLNKAAKNMIEKAVLSADVSQFHNGVTADDVREFYTLYYTAWMEETATFNRLSLTDDQVDAMYDEFALDFQTCSVASYMFYVDENGTYKTMDEATAAAKALTDCKTPEEFRATAIRLMVETGEAENEEKAAQTFDSTYAAEGVGYNEEYDVAKWLFNKDTKVGDTNVATGDDYVTVYMLTKAPAKETTPLARVYHLYLSTDSYGDATALSAVEAEIMSAWEAGDGTAEDFLALVREYTADFNTYDGVFWELEASPTISQDFTAWCFDDARNVGDVTSITSTHGRHILYYVGMEEMWRAQVITTAQSDASTAASEELSKTYPITFKDDAIQTIVL